MKKTLTFLAALAVLMGAASCQKEDPILDVQVKLALDGAAFAKADVAVTLKDAAGVASFDARTDAAGIAKFQVKAGAYTADASFKDASAGVMYTYTGQVNAMVAQGAENIFTLTLNRVETKQIIIKELYNTGCPAAGGKSFANDAYVTLYNNSDVEADASNLVFGVLQPGNAQANNKFYADGGEVLLYENAGWIPAYSAIWFFKGETKIAPYSSLTVAIFGAVDHTATYPESVDLSDPSYYVMAKEGVSQITNSKYQISDNIPAANYLSAYMFNRGNAWVLSTTSPAFFIATMENSALKALLEDTDSFDRTCGNDDIGWAPKFPVANIVDAVEVWAADQVDKSKLRFPASVNVGRVEITSKLGHTAYRNVDKEATEAIAENKGLLVTGYAADPSGIDAEASAAKGAKIVFKKTNNSGNDFHEREKQAIKK